MKKPDVGHLGSQDKQGTHGTEDALTSETLMSLMIKDDDDGTHL